MRTILRTAALAMTLLVGLPAAQAATQSWNFGGTLDSGHYSGQSFAGSFSFDDTALTGTGGEYLAVGSLSLNFIGNVYTKDDAAVGATPEVSFYDGAFLGLAYSVETPALSFTFIPGMSSIGESFVAYDTTAGLGGAGSAIYAPVPEPESYAMLLAGLGLLGLARRRTRSA